VINNEFITRNSVVSLYAERIPKTDIDLPPLKRLVVCQGSPYLL